MWTAQSKAVKNGQRFLLHRQGVALSNHEFFRLLATQADFAGWYNNLLAKVEVEDFFWEFPPLSTASLDLPVEFVAIAGPALAGLHPDPYTFRNYFAAANASSIAVFQNLGGDAVLIAPVPQNAPATTYTHLANFVRTASDQQCRDLWMQTGKEVQKRLNDMPLWLSTSGLGVGWLHVRLDSTPKYYQHMPYKSFAG